MYFWENGGIDSPKCWIITLPETNGLLAPEHRPGPKRKFHLPTINFQVRTVSFREGNSSPNHPFSGAFCCLVLGEGKEFRKVRFF